MADGGELSPGSAICHRHLGAFGAGFPHQLLEERGQRMLRHGPSCRGKRARRFCQRSRRASSRACRSPVRTRAMAPKVSSTLLSRLPARRINQAGSPIPTGRTRTSSLRPLKPSRPILRQAEIASPRRVGPRVLLRAAGQPARRRARLRTGRIGRQAAGNRIRHSEIEPDRRGVQHRMHDVAVGLVGTPTVRETGAWRAAVG